jgi:hypothetical protein
MNWLVKMTKDEALIWWALKYGTGSVPINQAREEAGLKRLSLLFSLVKPHNQHNYLLMERIKFDGGSVGWAHYRINHTGRKALKRLAKDADDD